MHGSSQVTTSTYYIHFILPVFPITLFNTSIMMARIILLKYLKTIVVERVVK